MVSEDLSFQVARGQRPEPRQLMPRAVVAVVKRRGRAVMLMMGIEEYIFDGVLIGVFEVIGPI